MWISEGCESYNGLSLELSSNATGYKGINSDERGGTTSYSFAIPPAWHKLPGALAIPTGRGGADKKRSATYTTAREAAFARAQLWQQVNMPAPGGGERSTAEQLAQLMPPPPAPTLSLAQVPQESLPLLVERETETRLARDANSMASGSVYSVLAVVAVGPHPRPRGAAPHGAGGIPKKWNASTGEWEEAGIAVAAAASAVLPVAATGAVPTCADLIEEHRSAYTTSQRARSAAEQTVLQLRASLQTAEAALEAAEADEQQAKQQLDACEALAAEEREITQKEDEAASQEREALSAAGEAATRRRECAAKLRECEDKRRRLSSGAAPRMT